MVKQCGTTSDAPPSPSMDDEVSPETEREISVNLTRVMEQEEKVFAMIKKSSPMAELEMAYAELVYLRRDGNMVKTASVLGVDRRTLYRWFRNSLKVPASMHSLKGEQRVILASGEKGEVIGTDPKFPNQWLVRFDNGTIGSYHRDLIKRA